MIKKHLMITNNPLIIIKKNLSIIKKHIMIFKTNLFIHMLLNDKYYNIFMDQFLKYLQILKKIFTWLYKLLNIILILFIGQINLKYNMIEIY
jgi:hypothetical protein